MRSDPASPGARATIVVTQRERCSAMTEALDSLYGNSAGPFELIYVTGALPAARRRWLDAQARDRGFTVVDAGRPLTPPEARNLGAARAATDYVVFIENDVVVTAGWLDALVACADETRADVVAPLTCEGRPIHTYVHHVGAALTNEGPFGEAAAGGRDFDEEFVLQGRTRQAVADQLTRRRTQTCEFHCVLVRRSLFAKTGLFDPDIVSKEYLDFSWAVDRAGGQIWLEPAAVVTFLIPSHHDPVHVSDLPYFLLRWSREWQRRSHDALKAKWGLQEEGYVAGRRALADWRLVDHLVKPLLEKAPVLGRRWGFVNRGARLVYPLVAMASSTFARRYDRQRRRAAGQARAHA